MDNLRKYGLPPFKVILLHGGPGAAGEMRPVAEYLSSYHSVLELFQTEKTIDGQVEELYSQINTFAVPLITLIGYSWGAWLATIFAGRHRQLVEKLILVSAGAFDSKYNAGLLNVRLNRLPPKERKEAERLLIQVNTENPIKQDTLERFGRLISQADCYNCIPGSDTSPVLNPEIYRSVWAEASVYRDSGKLLTDATRIDCEVVAFHGDYDSHPIEGVEIPLSEKISDFRMIRLPFCGHTPWKEKEAKDLFYGLLLKECKE